jgi:hypothetical protein
MKTTAFLAAISFTLMIMSCGPGGTAEDQHKHEFRMKQEAKSNQGSQGNADVVSPEAPNANQGADGGYGAAGQARDFGEDTLGSGNSKNGVPKN